MTREEADFIGGMNMCDEISNEAYKKIMCHCEDQELCNDAISRQEVLDIVDSYSESRSNVEDVTQDIISDILALPSVNSQPKIGHWIYTPKRRLVDETDDGGVYITDYKCTCSECGGDFGFQKMSDAYCKYCGARMINSQESIEDIGSHEKEES